MKTLAACLTLLFLTVLEIPSERIIDLTIWVHDDAWHLSFRPDGTAALGFGNSLQDMSKFPHGALPPLEEVQGRLATHLLNTKGKTIYCVSIFRGQAVIRPQYPDAEAERYIRELFRQAFAKARFSDPGRIAALLKKFPLDPGGAP